MCQQQQYDMSSQIEILFENGMPRKLGKSVAKTLKKRVAAAAAAAAAVTNNNNNNNNTKYNSICDDVCINCEQCGGCLKPKNDFTKRCICDDVSTPSTSTSDEEFEEEQSNLLVRTTKANTENGKFSSSSSSASSSASSTDIDSDESLEDSDSGFRTSSRKITSSSSTTAARRTCPMAGLLSNARAIETSPESQTTPSVPVPSTTHHTYQDDILAIFTQLTKKVIRKVNQFAFKVQKSKTYRVLSKSTQPAHVIAVGILSFVLLAVWPNLLENEEAALHSNERRSGWALVAYLGAFATHFGAQIWMTFVSGLSLYFALPRHTFGLCQQILFPKYFAMNSMLSILTLILFIKVIAGHWEFSAYVQVIALTICAVIEVTVRLYLAPPLLRLMREKHKFEITVGSGQEVGQLEPGDLVKCPHYQGIHKAFRRIHMTVAMGNLTALVCTFLHLHYLASKISVG